MILYLVRHAEAVERSGQLNDEARWLTSAGRKGFARMARRLHKRHVRAELIVASPLVRAVQTAELLAAEIGHHAELEASPLLAPAGSADGLAAWLGSLKKRRSVALVGHEPLLGELAARLVGRPLVSGLAKGSCLALELGKRVPDKPADILWYQVPGRKPVTKAKRLVARD